MQDPKPSFESGWTGTGRTSLTPAECDPDCGGGGYFNNPHVLIGERVYGVADEF